MIFTQSSWSFIYSCRILLKFSSSDPKPLFSFCPLSMYWLFKIFCLLLKNHWDNFNQTWHITFLGIKGDFFKRNKGSSFSQNADIDIFAFLIQCTGIIIGCWSLCSVRNCFLGEPCGLWATYFTITNYVLFPPSKPIEIYVLDHQHNFVFMI